MLSCVDKEEEESKFAVAVVKVLFVLTACFYKKLSMSWEHFSFTKLYLI